MRVTVSAQNEKPVRLTIIGMIEGVLVLGFLGSFGHL